MNLPKSGSLTEPALWSRSLQFLAFAVLLFGVRLWIIGAYGNATPFWDQWDAEAAFLYKPFLSGTLSWSDLFSSHTNHRIFTTRLLDLTLLKVNTTWNPLLQMVVNAALHILAIVFFISLLSKTIGRNHLPALLLFSFILFGIPFAWENVLCGFQCQFYFMILFSIASLWLIATKEPLSMGWWGGFACAILAFFSLASGVFVAGAAAITGLIIYLFKIRRTKKQIVSVVILFLLFLLFFKITPLHETADIISLHNFFEALISVSGWPVSPGILSALIRNLPVIIFVLLIFRKFPQATDKRWFLFCLVGWSAGQALSLSYGRSSGPLASRYQDLFIVIILLNFASLIYIIQAYKGRWKKNLIIAGGAWSLIIIFSLLRLGLDRIPDELAGKRRDGLSEEIKTRNYLATGDIRHFEIKDRLDIPYPFADRLQMILSWPEIRKILPSNIRQGLNPSVVQVSAGDAFVKNGYYTTTTGYPDSAWGSYGPQGDIATGSLSMRFDTSQPGGRVLIPVSGYPLSEGIKLEIEQEGVRTPVILAGNPKESWVMVETKLKKGPFIIHASDLSKTTWVALGKPLLEGRLDSFVNWLLSQYFMFLIAGILIIIFLLIVNGFKNQIDSVNKPVGEKERV